MAFGGSGRARVLRQHDDDVRESTDIGQLVHVLVVRDTAQRETTALSRDLEGRINILNGKGHSVHTNRIRRKRFYLDCLWLEVLKKLDLALTSGRLEHGDLGTIAVEANGRLRPITLDGVAPNDVKPEIGKECDCGFDVTHRYADINECDLHGFTLGRYHMGYKTLGQILRATRNPTITVISPHRREIGVESLRSESSSQVWLELHDDRQLESPAHPTAQEQYR